MLKQPFTNYSKPLWKMHSWLGLMKGYQLKPSMMLPCWLSAPPCCKSNKMALVRVLEYASRRLTPAKTCYSNTEQELLAITLALALKFCHDLEFNRFVLYIDHKLLLANFRLKQPSLQTIRLLMKIEGFDYVLQHALGSTMVVADVLSRMVPHPGMPSSASSGQCQLGQHGEDMLWSLGAFSQVQRGANPNSSSPG
jgi:hypothetical protein